MATETRVAGETQATDDYQAVPKPRARVSPEVRIAPTCMIWSIVVGLAVMVCIVLMWGVQNLGVLDFPNLFP